MLPCPPELKSRLNSISVLINAIKELKVEKDALSGTA